ncbi:hypothetical protein CEXT_241311 [Caerostris extrusa]|uniref:Uncharacterized protein n=1 Tax=Caerostris extrusa TaxID=172846 RepID=A0AAV4WTB9_CAEEX|nr:hypothetical protein CEXT_241311 [Caerostris extrusa]
MCWRFSFTRGALSKGSNLVELDQSETPFFQRLFQKIPIIHLFRYNGKAFMPTDSHPAFPSIGIAIQLHMSEFFARSSTDILRDVKIKEEEIMAVK